MNRTNSIINIFSGLYSQAVEKMKKLEICSSVSQTEDDADSEIKLLSKKRNVQKTWRFKEFDLDSDESDELPAVPQLLKIPQKNIKPKETPDNQLKIHQPVKNLNLISSDNSAQNELSILDNVTFDLSDVGITVTNDVANDKNQTFLCNGCKTTEGETY